MSSDGHVAPISDAHAAALDDSGRSGERRIDLRVLLAVPVLFDADSAQGVTQSKNISARGIELDAHPHLRVGSRVLLYLELPIGLAFEERALVVRESHKGIVLRFLALSQNGRAALNAYVRRELLRSSVNDANALKRTA